MKRSGRWALIVVLAVLAVWGLLTAIVEREAGWTLAQVKPGQDSAAPKGLVLYHPSRDARFSDELSLALAEGFADAGLAVDRGTITGRTPGRPAGYAVVAIVSNTYNWTPDFPTLRYLRRARFEGIPVVGVIGGAGATGRSERLLRRALVATGGQVLRTRSFWLWRPNDESRPGVPNRLVARDQARGLGREVGRAIRP